MSCATTNAASIESLAPTGWLPAYHKLCRFTAPACHCVVAATWQALLRHERSHDHGLMTIFRPSRFCISSKASFSCSSGRVWDMSGFVFTNPRPISLNAVSY